MARYLSSAQDMALYRVVVTVVRYGMETRTVYGPYSRKGTAANVGSYKLRRANHRAESASYVVEQASTVWTPVP